MSTATGLGPQSSFRAEPIHSPIARRRWFALAVLCAGMLMIVLDATIVNVALPEIRSDLGFSQSNLAWVVNGYLIAFGGLLLLAGRLGDLVGRTDVFGPSRGSEQGGLP
jgi:MFS family permease